MLFESLVIADVMNAEVVVEEDEEVVYEEVPQPQVIETGDSVKVKQVLDESTVTAFTEAGYSIDYSWDNKKLFLMFISCVFALIAQFYPMPFPQSRLLLAVCCGAYFILSSILQFIVTFVDKDTILYIKRKEVSGKVVVAVLTRCLFQGVIEHEMQIRTAFPRFQEYFTLTIQFRDQKVSTQKTVGKMYVGKYFTSTGEYDEVWLFGYVNRLF